MGSKNLEEDIGDSRGKVKSEGWKDTDGGQYEESLKAKRKMSWIGVQGGSYISS
jgi:hypothetical protein